MRYQPQPVMAPNGHTEQGSPLDSTDLFPCLPVLAKPVADLSAKVAQSYAVIDEMLAEHDPTHVIAMFSGGHDSLCATHLISQHPRFSFAAHINTTIGVEETRQFVRDTCRERQWTLKEYRPPVPYREIVLKYGFPGPGGHQMMYVRLKEKALDQCIREHKAKWKDRIALITGVRLSESTRRMGHVVPVSRSGAKVWTAPILHWNDDDKAAYMALHGLRRNPVVDALCMSGECLCGAFAKPEEFAEIQALYPAAAAELSDLMAAAAAAGVHAKWGTRPPGAPAKPDPRQLALCFSCQERAA